MDLDMDCDKTFSFYKTRTSLVSNIIRFTRFTAATTICWMMVTQWQLGELVGKNLYFAVAQCYLISLGFQTAISAHNSYQGKYWRNMF